jgi:hypothetical protein
MPRVTPPIDDPCIASPGDGAIDRVEVDAVEKEKRNGFVLVWMALLLLVLLALGGFAVDLGHWYYVANKEQKAADAAALAGAVSLPGDMPRASNDAKAVAVQNGFAVAETATAQGANPAQLEVTITHTVQNFFTSMLGYKTQTLVRKATAEFQGPVPMGSPSNTFGNEPVGASETRYSNVYTAAIQPQEWANVAGPQQDKSAGDAYQGQVCKGQVPNADDCVIGAHPPPDNNLDYKQNGFFYKVRVPASLPGKTLSIEVFDPAHVEVGDTCGSNVNGTPADPDNRYAAGLGPFCTGDSGTSAANVPTASYVVRAPDNTPADDTDNVPIAGCKHQYAGYSSGNLPADLTAGNYPTAVFRKWVVQCAIVSPIAGDYILQVRSNVALGNDPAGVGDKNLQTAGHNRFSIRAGIKTAGIFDVVNSPLLSVFADGYMAQYANATGASASFFLARILPGSAGRTLHLDFFDIADAAGSGDVSLTLSDTGSTFSGCTGTRGPPTGSMPDCTIHGATNGPYNGRWIGIDVPIPNNYACNTAVATGCWVKLNYNYGSGNSVTDTTSWAASLKGDPVRLVK